MIEIDRDSPEPLYSQLKNQLLQYIQRNNLVPGDRLPTEEELKADYQLSRTTIRHAFRELETEGVITRTRRRGTFVANPKVIHEPEISYDPFSDDDPANKDLYWCVLASQWIEAEPELRERLQVEPGEKVYRLSRLHLANERPIGYHNAHVSPAFSDAIAEDRLMVSGTLTYLSGTACLKGSYAERVIEAIPAGPRESALLMIRKGTPLMKVHRIVYSAHGDPIEDLEAYYRWDHFLYRVSNLPSVIYPDTEE